MFHLASPYWLLGLLIIPGIIWWKRKKKSSSMKFTEVEVFSGIRNSFKANLYRSLKWFEVAVIGITIIGLARPQIGRSFEEITTKGIDIVLALDISSSMRTIDFPEGYSVERIKEILFSKRSKIPPPRITLAKRAAKEFIKARKNDRIGLVVFAKQSFTQCPLTLDHNILLELLEKVHIGMIEDGTAIGMGIATALNRLKESKAKSKIIVLLTDGRNNAGKIDPLTAADLASSLGIKIYVIGAGNTGISVHPVETVFGTRYAQVPEHELNEEELQKIANTSGGLYFLAETPGALKHIFKTIDKLEKVEIKSKRYTLYREIYKYFVLIGIAVLMIQIILSFGIVPKIP